MTVPESRRSFGPEPSEASVARRFAGDVVATWGVHCADLELVVGELTANAVVHGRAAFELCVRKHTDCLVVEVTDPNPQVPQVRSPGPESKGGRGLLIVDRLATSWGSRPASGGGKVVWAEVPVEG